MKPWLRRLGVAFAVMVALALPSGVIGLIQYRTAQQTSEACVDRKHQYDALHAVIVQQNTPQKPSELILRAFPQFRPFYEPGNPSYDEAQRLAREHRDEVLRALGARPDC